MPWHVAKSSECADSKPWAVIKDDDDSVVACHESEQSAKDQVAALYASENDERGRHMGDERQTIRGLWQRFKNMVTIALDAQEVVEGLADSEADQFRAIGMGRVMEQVWGLLQTEDSWAWPIDVYIGDDWIYALATREGKLYRINLFLEGEQVRLGEWQQVTEIHQPVAQRMLVQRQADGRWRWLNISASAVLNRVGEIDSRQLFDNMARRASESGEYPYRTFYHMGESFRIGQADLLARDGALYITSGIFDDNPLAQAIVRALQDEPDYWGDSIGYLPIGEPERVEVAAGVEVPVYNDGIHREISTLPEQRAASLFTMPSVQQEVNRMRADVLEALERLRDKHGLAQDVIDGFVEIADQTNRSIEDEDLIVREDIPAEPEPEAETQPEDEQEREAGEPEPAQDDGDLEVELDEDAVSAIVDRVAEAQFFVEQTERMDGIQASITELMEGLQALKAKLAEDESRLAELEQDEEERQRQWLEDQPRRRTLRVSHRPREANQRPKGSGEKSLADDADATLASMPRY